MMQMHLTNHLVIENPPESVKGAIAARLTFDNPAWLENEKRGRWNGNTGRYIKGYVLRANGTMIMPRGFIGQAVSICRAENYHFMIGDRRRTLTPATFNFSGELRPYQKAAIADVLKKDFGTLVMPTGSGKTVVALAIIAERQQPTLVIVHTKELLNQWIDRIQSFLNIPKDDIGVIGDGKQRIGKAVTIGTVQSVVKIADEIAPHFGFVIVDECHHCPSRTFTEAVTCFDSKYMLGLSATPWRRDGLSRLIYWHVGDKVHEIEKADSIAQYIRSAGITLVLSDRKTHCERLRLLLERRGIDAEVLTGDRSAKERKDIVDRLNNGSIKTLVATGQLIGEGFDCPAFSTLFMCTPIKFNGRLIQYLGRVLRPAPGKDKAIVVDFIDSHIGVLRAAAREREKTYAAAGGSLA